MSNTSQRYSNFFGFKTSKLTLSCKFLVAIYKNSPTACATSRVKSRGVAEEDPSEAYDALRMALNQFVTGVQVIHLHCFDGNKEVVDRWLSSFTPTYFSFARVVDHFTDDQRASLRAIDDARILLETNSPFIKFSGHRASTPAQIGMAARSVAVIRGGTWRTVLALATRNARRLFDQRLEPACDWTNTQAKPFSRPR